MLIDELKSFIEEINPRLEELAQGTVEFLEFDREGGVLKLKLIGGRLC